MIKNKTFSVSYFLGRAFFLGFGFSLLFKLLDKDAWIASLLGVLLGSLFIWFFQKFKENHALTNILKKSIAIYKLMYYYIIITSQEIQNCSETN